MDRWLLEENKRLKEELRDIKNKYSILVNKMTGCNSSSREWTKLILEGKVIVKQTIKGE